MNSATLLYNARSAFRRKAWFTALVSATLLFSLTISGAMNLQRQLRFAATGGGSVAGAVESIFSYSNTGVMIPLMIAAFVAGLVFFGYLQRPDQVDLFHSLPISRRRLFFANYLAGAAAVLLPWLANLLLSLVVVLAMGGGAYLDCLRLLTGFAIHLLFFLAIYTLTALAMLMTGHRLVGGLLALVFLGIGPMILGMYRWLGEMFYPTWYSQLIDWSSLIAHSSPAARYITLVTGNYHLNSLSAGDIAALLALIIGGMALCLFCYGRRPSEAAGRALAFPASRPFIKYPLVVLAIGGMAMTLFEIGDSSWLWYSVGALLGGFICAQALEIINAFDFRAIGRRLLPLAIVLAVFLGGSLFCAKDTTHFNDYVPEPAEVAQVELVLNGLSDTDGYLISSYTRDSDHAAMLRQLEIDDEAFLRRGLLTTEAGIAAAVDIAGRLVADFQQHGATEAYTPDDENRNQISAYIRYTLKDGSVKTRYYRRYSVVVADIAPQLDAIYAEQRFRQGLYPLFDFPAEQVALLRCAVYEDYVYGRYDWREGEKNYANTQLPDIAALLEVYQQELLAMTAAELRAAPPVGLLEFQAYAAPPTAEQVYNGGLPGRNLSYPVYASMSGTIAALAAIPGAPAAEAWQPRYEEAVEAKLITGVNTRGMGMDVYAEKYGEPVAADTAYPMSMNWGGETELITDPARIRELLEQTYPGDSDCSGFIDIDQTRELLVTYKNDLGELTTQYRWFML